MILAAAEANNRELHRLYGLELIPEQLIAVIVNTAPDEDIRLHLARLLVNETMANFSMKIKISSGRIYDSPAKIQASFLEAKAAMADSLFLRENVILFEELKGEEVYVFPVIEQSLFIQSVKQANLDAALKALDAMIDRAANAGAAPVMQCLCYEIINTLMKIAGELKSEVPLRDLKALTGFADLEQFRLSAREITEDICLKSVDLRKEKDSRLKSAIISYVQESFCNAQFSLQELADHFGLGVSYLSRFFKQEMGCNFVDYVSMLRLDKVKEFLVSTDKQVKEIVYDVGYMDTASFVRKFRAREGITTGQSRDRMKGENEIMRKGRINFKQP
jgi:YesN/AraC family two-component response regulator